MTTETEIGRSARELVEHYGKEAIGIAQDRVEELRNSGDYLAMDVALRILTQCERLLDKGRGFEPTGD